MMMGVANKQTNKDTTMYLGGMCSQLTVVESPIPQLDFTHSQSAIVLDL